MNSSSTKITRFNCCPFKK